MQKHTIQRFRGQGSSLGSAASICHLLDTPVQMNRHPLSKHEEKWSQVLHSPGNSKLGLSNMDQNPLRIDRFCGCSRLYLFFSFL